MLVQVGRNTDLALRIDSHPALGRTLQPRDIFALRNFFFGSAAHALHQAAARIGERAKSDEVSLESLVKVAGRKMVDLPVRAALTGLLAHPFFLDGAAAAAFLDADDPDTNLLADLRLPYRHCLVFLGSAFEIEPRSPWFDPKVVAAFDNQLRLARRLLPAAMRQAIANRQGPIQSLYERGGRLHGALLCADEHGLLTDTIGWLVSAPAIDVDDWESSVLWGRLSEAEMAPLAHRLAAAIAWMPWNEPTPTDAEALLGEKSGRFRRVVNRPAALGVHTVDLTRRQPRGPGTDGGEGAEDAKVRPHLRRGHWRRVRLATRDGETIVGRVDGTHGIDWHYAGRWIAPTVVGADATFDARRVYRLPAPRNEH